MKMSLPMKQLKPLKQGVINEIVAKKFPAGAFTIEHIGTLRNKPYLKLGTSAKLSYRVSHINPERIPSLATLVSSAGDIIRSTEALLHICPERFNIVAANQETLTMS